MSLLFQFLPAPAQSLSAPGPVPLLLTPAALLLNTFWFISAQVPWPLLLTPAALHSITPPGFFSVLYPAPHLPSSAQQRAFSRTRSIYLSTGLHASVYPCSSLSASLSPSSSVPFGTEPRSSVTQQGNHYQTTCFRCSWLLEMQLPHSVGLRRRVRVPLTQRLIRVEYN